MYTAKKLGHMVDKIILHLDPSCDTSKLVIIKRQAPAFAYPQPLFFSGINLWFTCIYILILVLDACSDII